MSAAVQLGLLLLVAGTDGLQARATVAPVETRLRLDVDVSQFFTDDTGTDINRLFTDLRLRTEAADLFGVRDLSFSLDGRGRYGFDEHTLNRYDLTRAYFQYGADRSWSVGAGRIPILEIGTAQVDGGRVAFGIGDVVTSVFGGLIPHPITGGFNASFYGGGAAYEFRNATINNAGGVFAQLYRSELDRVYATERIYLRFGRELSIFGSAIVDFVSREGVDLTQGLAVVRYRPANFIDFSLTGSHVHALLPNKWWDDWVEQERARLGFTLDGPLPVGTRRSNARLVTNFHLFGFMSPYVSGRFDFRHEDEATGYEAKGGLKLAQVGLGYADLYGGHRDYFGTKYQLGGVQLGLEAISWFGADAGFGVLHHEESGMIYDVNATLWGLIGPVRLIGMYQAFVEPEVLYHVFFLRAGYRFDG